MTIIQAKKRRWSSRSLLGIRSTKRKVSSEQGIIQAADGAADQPHAIDISFDDYRVADRDRGMSTSAKIQRSGSKLLSIVGIQARNSGESLPQSKPSEMT